MDSHHHRPCYVLTHDLGNRIVALRDLGLATPDRDDRFFDRFREGLEKRVAACVPQADIKSITLGDLAQRIWTEAIRQQSGIKNAVIVSTTYDIAVPRRGHILEINRLFDPCGKWIGHGPRPGHPTMREQIHALARLAAGNPVVLAEDGAFTGHTVVDILRRFDRARIPVSTVVLGLATPQGLETIREAFDGAVVCVEQIPSIIEWMPDHDFFPFAPNGGRGVGVPFGDEAIPLYTHLGASFAIPYVRPFGDLETWASIPSDRADDLSGWCVRHALELFERIERMNGETPLTVRDLIGTRPGVCIPVRIDVKFHEERFPRLDAFVKGMLIKACQDLA